MTSNTTTTTPAKKRAPSVAELQAKRDALKKKLEKTAVALRQAQTAQRARERTAKRRLEDGQKLLVGAAVLAGVNSGEVQAAWLAKLLREKLTRPIDKTRIAPVLAELEKQQQQGAGDAR